MLEESKHIYFKILKHINDTIEIHLSYENSINFTFVNMFQCNYVINVSLYADCSCSNCSCQEKEQSMFQAKANSKAATNALLIHLLYLGLLCFSFLF